jgi:chemotaxis protein CheD
MKSTRPWLAYRRLHVHPGECQISAEPDIVISTLLGSCIAACLFDATSGVGGLNHFLLPEGSTTMLYGTYAMESLVNGLLGRGCRRKALHAKAFGGASMGRGSSALEVSRRNIAFVRIYLQNETLPLIAEDVGGTQARRIWMHAASGRVWVERLPALDSRPLAQTEQKYRSEINRSIPAGEIDIFR